MTRFNLQTVDVLVTNLHHHLVYQMDVAVGALDVRSDNPSSESVILDKADSF